MPIRLVLFLVAIAAGFLYLTFLNSDTASLALGPDIILSLPMPLLLLAAFSFGVVTVMLLYFFDAFIDTFTTLKRSSLARRERRLIEQYEQANEKLVIGSRRAAEKRFNKALAIDPEHIPSLIALGSMKREDGEFTEAVKLHSKARGLDEESAVALMELAEDYMELEQYTNAVGVLQDTQKLVGKSLPPLMKIRDIYVRVGNIKEALVVQKQIVSKAPITMTEHERGMLVALKYEDALEKLAAADFYSARDDFKSVLKSDNHFIPAYLKLAEVFERIDAPKEAIKILEKGFKATHSLTLLKALEIFLLAKGDEDRIVDSYIWAKGLLPGENAIHLFLAEAYLRKEDFESARKEMESVNGSLINTTLFHLVEGRIRQNENNIDLALASMSQAYQREVATFFQFTCSSCGSASPEYAGRCRSCGTWNTLQPSLF